MNCIICNKDANATGSHIVPASLIQNCVGKHYREESYKIDVKAVNIDVYYGRDNLKNTSTEIKENHYKKNHILCQECEDKLALIESNFSSNFLQKFRDDKYKQNFKFFKNKSEVELLTPLRYDKDEFYFYLYSVIYRFCINSGLKDDEFFLKENELNNLKSYLNEYLYGNKIKAKEFLSKFYLVISFDKSNTNGSHIASDNQFQNPYLFYFCEPILFLFTEELEDEAKHFFGLYTNNITNNDELKIVISSDFYSTFRDLMPRDWVETYITNAVNKICKLNSKSYQDNLKELYNEMRKYDEEDKENVIKALESLKQKYSS